MAIPALLCVAGSLFALYQFCLIAIGARRVHRAGGPRGPAISAALAGLVGILATGWLVHDRAVPQLLALWDIERGDITLNNLAIVVADKGRTLRLDGSFGMGAEKQLRAALEANPEAALVVLDGPGGRLGPAFEMFKLLRERALVTRVEGLCESACALAFLGGTRRELGPNGILGFHGAGFPGMDKNELADANRGLEQFLVRLAGVHPRFARYVVETPVERIWRPSPEDLQAGNVVHFAAPRTP